LKSQYACAYTTHFATLAALLESFAAAASNTNGEPQAPVPFDDSYTISGVTNRPISELLNVLANDMPKNGFKIIGLKAVSSPLYGTVTFTESSISYSVESYDGTEVTDYFK
jgi:hypothetical protein